MERDVSGVARVGDVDPVVEEADWEDDALGWGRIGRDGHGRDVEEGRARGQFEGHQVVEQAVAVDVDGSRQRHHVARESLGKSAIACVRGGRCAGLAGDRRLEGLDGRFFRGGLVHGLD